MINRKVWLFLADDYSQYERTPAGSQYFQKLVLAVMLSHDLARNAIILKEFSHLVCVPSGDQHLMIPLSKFIDNWPEERNVRRIVKIHPDLPVCGLLSRRIPLACRLEINYISSRRHWSFLLAVHARRKVGSMGRGLGNYPKAIMQRLCSSDWTGQAP